MSLVEAFAEVQARAVSVVVVVLLVPSCSSRIPALLPAPERKLSRPPHQNVLSLHYRAEKKKKKLLQSSSKRHTP
jgi:hypothetical protein